MGFPFNCAPADWLSCRPVKVTTWCMSRRHGDCFATFLQEVHCVDKVLILLISLIGNGFIATTTENVRKLRYL